MKNQLIERWGPRMPFKLNHHILRTCLCPLSIVSMSSTNEPTRRMLTRAGARDKIAKVMERVCSDGIVEQDPSQSEDDNTLMTKKPTRWKLQSHLLERRPDQPRQLTRPRNPE
jgi:hypothetical protein